MSPQPPPGSARTSRTQRLLLGIAAGLGVTVIAGAVFTVTYADLKALAVSGHASHRLAPAYPVMYDALITVTILALVLAWQRRWWSRWSRWLLLLLLLAGSGATAVERSVQGFQKLPHTWVKAGVAVAPELILLIAIWLWLGMFRHARTALSARTAPDLPTPVPDVAETDPAVVPGFDKAYEPRHQVIPQPEPEPVDETTPIARFTLPTDVRLVTRPPDQPEPAATPQPPEAEPEPEAIPTGRFALPTDVRLVAKPDEPAPAATTRPDIVIPADLIAAAYTPTPEPFDDEPEPEDRPEDPDAGIPTHPDWASAYDDRAERANTASYDDGATTAAQGAAHADWTAATPSADDQQQAAAAVQGEDHADWTAVTSYGDDQPQWATAPESGEDLSEWSAAAVEDVRRWATATAQDPAAPEDTPPSRDENATEDERPTQPNAKPENESTKTAWPPPSSTFRSSPTPPDTHEHE
jgi:Protein of unknown function (DUF2637)